jgi:hypothetical protein
MFVNSLDKGMVVNVRNVLNNGMRVCEGSMFTMWMSAVVNPRHTIE